MLLYFERICILGEAQGFLLFLTQYKEIKRVLFMRMDGLASNHCHRNSFQKHLSLIKSIVLYIKTFVKKSGIVEYTESKENRALQDQMT